LYFSIGGFAQEYRVCGDNILVYNIVDGIGAKAEKRCNFIYIEEALWKRRKRKQKKA
jgi:hypothetical protein